MSEWRLFTEHEAPEHTTPEWYQTREHAPHLEQSGHRDRLLLAAELVKRTTGTNLVDLGAGDGGLLTLVPPHIRCWGYDLQPTNVAAAEARGVTVDLLDVVGQWPRSPADEADTVVVTEFLEHLVDPHEMVRRIAGTRARWLVASSPYMETAESHYQFHTWAWDQDGYRDMLRDNGWHVVEQHTAFICQVVLAERA